MAAQDTLWADMATIRWELNVAQQDDIDAQLLRLLGSAIDEIERFTELPLRDRTAIIDRPIPRSNIPMFLGRIPYAIKVVNFEYWNENPNPGELPTETLSDQSGMLPDLGLSPARADEKYGDWWLRPPADGWPQGAVCARVSLLCGMAPAEHQAVSQAIVMLVRDYYEGVPVADRKPAWQRRLSGTPYTGFLPQEG